MCLINIENRSTVWWVLLLPSCFIIFEWLRTIATGGFGYFSLAHASFPLFTFQAWLPILGINGVSFLVLACVAALTRVIIFNKNRTTIFSTMAIVAIVVLFTFMMSGQQTTMVINDLAQNVQVINGGYGNLDKDKLYKNVRRVELFQRMALVNPFVNISVWPESSISRQEYTKIMQYTQTDFDKLKRQNKSVLLGAYSQVKNKAVTNAIIIYMETKQRPLYLIRKQYGTQL